MTGQIVTQMRSRTLAKIRVNSSDFRALLPTSLVTFETMQLTVQKGSVDD
jgi:hypothetical protein